ncbi:MAG: hypothetical protein AB7S57_22380, partial [Acetobacteraceae bacterium]
MTIAIGGLKPAHPLLPRLRGLVLPLAVLGWMAWSPTSAMSQTKCQAVDKHGDPLAPFHQAKFSRPTAITNSFLPMKPGTRYIYEGTAVEDDGKVVPHRI